MIPLTPAQQQALRQLTPARDPLTQGLECYVVGGAVRDALLGLPAGDKDWVVVGATPETLHQRGFIPVGGDFPVFLHPRTKEEYALARTERKSGRGYQGFTFYTGTDVSLYEDLRRRDLTINAMAVSAQGELLDPLHGLNDLQQRCLRHVGTAFAEDPVRLLRLARFAARFPNFTVAPDTLQLAESLVAEGEVDALVPERVWQELTKALVAPQPVRFVEVLKQVGALERVLPGLSYESSVRNALICAVERHYSLAQRFAVLVAKTAHARQLAQRLRATSEAAGLGEAVARALNASLLSCAQAPEQQWWALEQLDALRRPERFLQIVHCVQCYDPTLSVALWQQRLAAVQAVDAGAIARQSLGGGLQIKQAVAQARLDALQAL